MKTKIRGMNSTSIMIPLMDSDMSGPDLRSHLDTVVDRMRGVASMSDVRTGILSQPYSKDLKNWKMTEQTWKEFVEKENLDVSDFDLLKDEAYIKKVGKQWCVFGEGGRRMGCYSSRPAAEKRLKQIEMFKHMKTKKGSEEEFASFYCYCPECGAYFYTPHRCDRSLCPVCHDPDRNNIEVIGEF